MSPKTSKGNSFEEPKQRFYPPQGKSSEELPKKAQNPMISNPTPISSDHKKRGDASYLIHRHPMLLKRLYFVAETFLDTYSKQSFLYDAYPDYLSLRLMRDRLLKENQNLTEDFLQSGCPIVWLESLADTVISDLLCKKRELYRNPMGVASTTSVQSASLL